MDVHVHSLPTPAPNQTLQLGSLRVLVNSVAVESFFALAMDRRDVSLLGFESTSSLNRCTRIATCCFFALEFCIAIVESMSFVRPSSLWVCLHFLNCSCSFFNSSAYSLICWFNAFWASLASLAFCLAWTKDSFSLLEDAFDFAC